MHAAEGAVGKTGQQTLHALSHGAEDMLQVEHAVEHAVEYAVEHLADATKAEFTELENAFLRLVPPAFRMLTDWQVETKYEQQKRSAAGGSVGWKLLGHRFLASPVSSNGAALYSMSVLIFSILSVFSEGIQTTREARAMENCWVNGSFDASLYEPASSSWTTWNIVLISFFSLELLARILTYERFWMEASLYIDALCIVPIVLRLVIPTTNEHQTGVLQLYVTEKPLGVTILLIAAAAALRLMKTTRYLVGTKVLLNTLSKSISALVIPCYLLVMLLILFGTLVFAVE